MHHDENTVFVRADFERLRGVIRKIVNVTDSYSSGYSIAQIDRRFPDAILRRGLERGELRDESLVRFPHLIFAPLLMAVLWDGLFEPLEHLDVPAMLDAHRELLFAPTREDGA